MWIMKKTLLMLAVALLCACSSDDETSQNSNLNPETTEVTVGFDGFTLEQESMSTRLSAVGEICTKLDVWVYEGSTEFATYQQESGTDGFGTLSLTLNVQKEYTIYAVAHKAADHATLSNSVITFPENKVTHTFFIKHTFTPTKGMNLNLTLNRIVAQFSFNTTDAVPDWCKTMRFTISDVYDRWNVSTGATHQLDRVSTFQNFSTRADGTVTFNVYAIVTDEATNHDILVEGLDANGDVQESHTLYDVPLTNNQRTVATGCFFSDAASAFSFLAADWLDDANFSF